MAAAALALAATTEGPRGAVEVSGGRGGSVLALPRQKRRGAVGDLEGSVVPGSTAEVEAPRRRTSSRPSSSSRTPSRRTRPLPPSAVGWRIAILRLSRSSWRACESLEFELENGNFGGKVSDYFYRYFRSKLSKGQSFGGGKKN